ncbi:MAG: hypothetical protein ACRD3P_11350 [Terriglobales bacterium]
MAADAVAIKDAAGDGEDVSAALERTSICPHHAPKDNPVEMTEFE